MTYDVLKPSAGYLDAVFRALNGDGGDRLQEILNGNGVVISTADRAEYEVKTLEGIPLECPN